MPPSFANLRTFRLLAPFCAAWLAFSPPLPAADENKQTATELLNSGQTAFNGGQWKEAAAAFDQFIKGYGSVPELAEAVRRLRPLLALCQMRLEDYPAALPLLEEALKDTRLDEAMRSTLLFSQGVAFLKTSQFDAARRSFGIVFSDPKADGPKRADALVLGGMTYFMQGNWNGGIDFFKKYGDLMRRANPEAAARAEVLNINALMQATRWDEALATARALYARRSELRQLITFDTLLLQLGDHFLQDTHESEKAIAAFLLVEPREKLLTIQKGRLDDFRVELDALENNPQGFVRASQLKGTVADIERELAEFDKMPEFDAALRLRLAAAFQGADRYREAALILDQMVRQMKPNATVESATVSLLHLWMIQERWTHAVRSADLYLERFANFPDKKNLPEVLFLRAQALQGQAKMPEAQVAYAEMAEKFPQHELAPRALFFEAYCCLTQEHHADALKRFDALLAKNPPGDVWEDAYFWKGMTYYFDQKWNECREHLQSYLDLAQRSRGGKAAPGAPSGQYVAEAKFRRAYARFSQALYEETIPELEAFLRDHPQSDYVTEARLTLGDCLGAVGRTSDAIAQYRRIDTEHMAFFEDAYFKIGRILQATGEFAAMRTHYEGFVHDQPQSQRVTEALHWIGWCWQKENKPEEARRVYWDAIKQHGNDPHQLAIEDITTTIPSFYNGYELRNELEYEMDHERQAAADAGQKILATRLRWAQAQLIAKTKPDDSRALLLKTAAELDEEQDNPRILIDCATAARDANDLKLAEKLYNAIRKWHPRSLYKDQAWAGLGFIALQRGDKARATDCFDHFERATISPKTAPDPATGVTLVEGPLGAQVTLARADILATTGQAAKAEAIWKLAQKMKSYPSRQRAESISNLAQLAVSQGDHRAAVTYYEQIYVLYNRYPDLVAAAYIGRGEALEKLGEKEKAREVYSELAQRPDLATDPFSDEGRKRAESLGGLIAKQEAPADSVILPKDSAKEALPDAKP